MIEFWKNIPGYDGKYQVNTEGDIRLILPSGKARLLKPFKRNKHDPKFYVILRKDGKKYFKSVLYVVSRTFLGEPPKGYVAYYKNECYRESHLNNIGYFASDGYAYAYDEDEHAVKMLIRKIKKVNCHD